MSDGITDAMRPMREHWTAIEARKKRESIVKMELLTELFVWVDSKQSKIIRTDDLVGKLIEMQQKCKEGN